MGLAKFGLKLKREFDQVDVLHWGHLACLLLATAIESFKGHSGFFVILKIGLISGHYCLFTKTKKNLYYSFWTFAIILAIYFLFKIIQTPFGSGLFILYFMALAILGIEMYMLHSPIYYPIINWWEYDFRYRTDLKIQIELDGKIYDGRLTDLRRNAGCVTSFENISLGEKLHLTFFDEWKALNLKCEIMSCRQYSIGRPYYYGVRFFLENSENQYLFSEFCEFWKNKRKSKIRKKFTQQKIT